MAYMIVYPEPKYSDQFRLIEDYKLDQEDYECFYPKLINSKNLALSEQSSKEIYWFRVPNHWEKK